MVGHRFRRLAAALLAIALISTAGSVATVPVEERALPLTQWLADLADRFGLESLVGSKARSDLPSGADRSGEPGVGISPAPPDGTESAQGQGDGEAYPSLDPNG